MYQSVGCAKKQISVSHSSTESEIVSLDAGLRMDGLPALELWDLVIEVFRELPIPTTCSRETTASPESTPKIGQMLSRNVDLSNVDQVAANAHLSEKGITVAHFGNQRSCDKDDHQGKKSHNETRDEDPQSCIRLVIRRT